MRRHEVGVEDRDELARGLVQAGFQRSRLVARAIDAMEILDVEPARGMPAHRELGNFRRLVGRVVEDLNFHQLARIVDLADRVDQAVGDVHLVEDR